MADYFKPRRGTQAAAKEKLKDGKQLRTGELFFELEYAEGKTVKSGRIMIGDGRSNYAELVRNNRYVFNPDDYMGVTSKFEPTPSTETTILDNRNIINSANTNIKEKMGAIDATIDLLDENKSEKTHNHTTADITNFVTNVKMIKVNTASRADNASTADYATNAGTADNAVNASHAADATWADRAGYGIFNGLGKSKIYKEPNGTYKLLEPDGPYSEQGYSYSALIYAVDSLKLSKLYFYTRYAGDEDFSTRGNIIKIHDSQSASFSIDETEYTDNSTVNLVTSSGRDVFVHIFVMSGDFKLFGE